MLKLHKKRHQFRKLGKKSRDFLIDTLFSEFVCCQVKL